MEGGPMIGRLHALQSRVVDSAAFFGIGLWQLLGRAGRHSPQEWDDYVRNWLTRGGDEFYRVPDKIPEGLKKVEFDKARGGYTLALGEHSDHAHTVCPFEGAEVNVYEGRITSSPGPMFANMLAISKAWVHEGVRST